MTSFFYVVSIAFHTSVPALQKCMHTYGKKFFWLRAQPLLRRLLHLFVRPERLPSHCLFEWYKDMNVAGGEVWRVRRMWKTLKGQTWIVATVERAVWAEHCHVGAKHLYSDVHVIWTWLQDAGDSLGDLHTLYWSQGSPWAHSAPKLPLVYPKRESA